MVGRVGFEPTTNGLKVQNGKYNDLYINEIPGRPEHQIFVYSLDGFAVLGEFGQRIVALSGVKVESRLYLLERFI